MLGAIAFLIFFLLISPASRNVILAMLSNAKDWIFAWAPFSYILLLLLVMAPVVAYQLMVHWPAPKEPENPLARYKREAENLDVD